MAPAPSAASGSPTVDAALARWHARRRELDEAVSEDTADPYDARARRRPRLARQRLTAMRPGHERCMASSTTPPAKQRRLHPEDEVLERIATYQVRPLPEPPSARTCLTRRAAMAGEPANAAAAGRMAAEPRAALAGALRRARLGAGRPGPHARLHGVQRAARRGGVAGAAAACSGQGGRAPGRAAADGAPAHLPAPRTCRPG